MHGICTSAALALSALFAIRFGPSRVRTNEHEEAEWAQHERVYNLCGVWQDLLRSAKQKVHMVGDGPIVIKVGVCGACEGSVAVDAWGLASSLLFTKPILPVGPLPLGQQTVLRGKVPRTI